MMEDLRKDGITSRVWRIAGVAALGPLITNLDSTVVNVSLSAMGNAFNVQVGSLEWVVTGYLLALALMLPVSGWLIHRVGAKLVYLGCFAMFTAASILCGISPTIATLIAARVLQGMAGGLLAPMAQMMVAREAPRHIARVMGILVVPVLFAPIFGPSLAGVILEHASWRWIFFINLPVGLLSLALAAWILPRDKTSGERHTFDTKGFLLLSPGLVLLLYSLETLSAATKTESLPYAELVFSLLLLTGFLFHADRKGATALIQTRLFLNRSFRTAALTQFFSNALTYGGQLLLPLYLLSLLHFSPAKAGLLLAGTGLGAIVSYPLTGGFVKRLGLRRVSASGATVALLGTLPFLFFSSHSFGTPLICVALFIRGLGMGGITVPSIAAAYSSIAYTEIPVASTALNIVQRLGGPAATTALAIFLHPGPSCRPMPMSLAILSPQNAYASAFVLLCGIHAFSIAAALRLPVRLAS